MIEGRTILCFASGYDAPPTSKHHVMHLLAQANTVLWVNYHASRTPKAGASDLLYVARKLGEVAAGLRRPRRNLYTLTPLAAPLPHRRWARSLNRMLVACQIRRVLGEIRTGPLQVWSFAPDVAYLLGAFDAEKIVYYCVDDFASFDGYNSDQVLRDERELCRRASLVVTTSEALQQAKRRLNPNTILVTHGVDYRHFARALSGGLSGPDDLAGIAHPILGFFGLIREWVDLHLVAEVARRRPDWNFVFLGESRRDLGPYRRLPNMHFLGPKRYEDLPAYCKCFDAGMIPFKINDLTRAVNPIKLREYLAAGLPVVSTPLPEVRRYGGLVHVGATPVEFETAIESALGGDAGSARRRSLAMESDTWEQKLREISLHL